MIHGWLSDGPSDSYFDPPDHVGRSGEMGYFVERPVPRDDEEGWGSVDEFEALVTFDDGSFWAAIIDGCRIELTGDERRHAEDEWADQID